MSIAEIMFMSDVDIAPIMEVGAIVVPNKKSSIPLGAVPTLKSPKANPTIDRDYGYAVVVQLNPTMVLVSERADMRWESTVLVADFSPIGKVNPAALAVCMSRLSA